MKILWRRPTKSELKAVVPGKRKRMFEFIIVVFWFYFLAIMFPIFGLADTANEEADNGMRGELIFLAIFLTMVALILVGYIITNFIKYKKGDFYIIKGECVDKYSIGNILGGSRGDRYCFSVVVNGTADKVEARVDDDTFNQVKCGEQVLVVTRNENLETSTFWAYMAQEMNEEGSKEASSEEYRDYIGIEVRRAEEKDIPEIIRLLYQVNQVHADGRPDLFKNGGIKYTEADLYEKINREDEIIFVAEDIEYVSTNVNRIKGYLFGQIEITEETTCLRPNKTLYIDDLCVDESARGKGVGSVLYKYAKGFSISNDIDRITLHVWECNPGAQKFYENVGFSPLYTAMEVLIK